MKLYVVRKNKKLLWPAELYPKPGEAHTVPGWLHYMKRHPELRLRGEVGYVVDISDPREASLIEGQIKKMQPVSELSEADRPIAPSRVVASEGMFLPEEFEGEPEPEPEVEVELFAQDDEEQDTELDAGDADESEEDDELEDDGEEPEPESEPKSAKKAKRKTAKKKTTKRGGKR